MLSSRARPVLWVAIGHLVIELSSQFLPVVYPVLADRMVLNYTQIGVLALVASLGTSAAQPLFGLLSDRWDPRWMTVLSIAWIGVAMGMVGVAGRSGSYALLALTIGLGVLGSAAFHPPGATIVSSASTARRGASVSVFSVGGSVGSALSPLLVTAGLEQFGLWGTTVLIPVALAYSLVLYGYLRRAPQPAHRAAQRRATRGDRWAVAGLALVVLTVMSLAWYQVSLRTYLPMWIESRTGSLALGGQMLFVLAASMGVGSLLGGALSDRTDRWRLLAVCLVLLAPSLWLFVGAEGAARWALIGVIGVLLGGTFPVSIVIAHETWPSGVGIASGLVMGIGWLPGGIGASVTGAIADRLSLEWGLRALAVPPLVGLGCILAYAATRRRQKVEQGEAVPA
ncbi:MAG: MFS transporter [Anaerolineae bacterium]|nr:MFS transporter [Anaerolineae bacterium]